MAVFPGGADGATGPEPKRSRKSSVTITAGTRHLPFVAELVRRFRTSTAHLDFTIFHWDGEAKHNADWDEHSDSFVDVEHIWADGYVKLQFARESLNPQAVRHYEYVFVWNGDVQLTPEFDVARYLAIVSEAGAFDSQPALTMDPTSSYKFNRASQKVRNTSKTTEVGFVEVGFQVWNVQAWSMVWHEVLAENSCKYRRFDLLPVRYIMARDTLAEVEAQHAAIVQSEQVYHTGQKALNLNRSYIRKENVLFKEIRSSYPPSCAPKKT